MKILIADDNTKNLYMLEVLLKGAGYETATAMNGIEALQQLRASQFDGIVSDILMPVMDGFRLIRECKKDPDLRQIPFIFYTATYTEKKDMEFGLSLGAIRYIIKPAEPEELLSQIENALSDHSRSPRDYSVHPVPDEITFSREYTRRVGAKLEKKEQLLRESEERYRLLYESSMDAILLTSPDGTIQAANPAACTMLGLSEEEIIEGGRNTVIDGSDPRLPAALEERNRTGRFKGELTFLRKDGTRFPGEISSNTFTDRNGETRTSMIIRDITERKKAEEERESLFQELARKNAELDENQQKLELSLRAASAGVWWHEIRENKIYWSKEYAALLGHPDMAANPSRDFWAGCIHPEDRDLIFQVIQFPLTNPETEINIEYRIVQPDGHIRWLNDRGRIFSDDKGMPLRVLGISIDITGMKHLEDLKIKAFSQIEKNLEQLASLNDQIRNPLSIIVMLAEKLEDEGSKEIVNQAMQINGIIQQLDYGWTESEKVREFLKKHYHMFNEQGP